VKAFLFRALMAAGIALLLTNVAIVFLIEWSAPSREPYRPATRDAMAHHSPPEIRQRQQSLSVDCERSGAARCLRLLHNPSPRTIFL
jgi:hypothetical protein